MFSRQLHLKVKIKSLAAEAKIIRQEEKRCYDKKCRESLYLHRIGIVRDEARLSQLAYGFLRGKPRSIIEQSNKWINKAKLLDMISRFGDKKYSLADISSWL